MQHFSKPIQKWESLQSKSPCHCLWLSNGIWSNHKGQLTGWYKKWIFFFFLTHQGKAPCCNAENLLCKKNTPSFSTWLLFRRFWLGFLVYFLKYWYKIARSRFMPYLPNLVTLWLWANYLYFQYLHFPIFEMGIVIIKHGSCPKIK